MNLLVVGVSYRTATVAVLERLAASPPEAPLLLTDLLSRAYVGEAMVLSTCNRVEVYAGVTAFHGGLADIVAVLAARAGSTPAELAPHLYVHYEAEAARHAFHVATGLDSMVVGEAQILGQLRDAYTLATERDTAGRVLHELMQQALRVGKRAHAETDIDHVGPSVVSAALDYAGRYLGGAAPATGPAPAGVGSTHVPEPADVAGPVAQKGGVHRFAGRSALVVGAGSMGALALATLRRGGAGQLLVANRDSTRAQHLAASHGATAVPLDTLADAVAGVDLVVCATAASGYVLTPDHITGPVVILDLAVPRDVDPAVAGLPGVTLIDMQRLAAELSGDKALGFGVTGDEATVGAIVAAEVEAYRLARRGADAAPTVAALRSRADDVVAAELARLRQRRPDLSDAQRAEVAQTVHRVVQRLLHQPTVRVREFAAEPGGDHYARILRELFDLEVPPVAETVADVPAGACDGDTVPRPRGGADDARSADGSAAR